MKKPIIRWTIGCCLPQGLKVLRESMRSAKRIFGDHCRYFVYYNQLEDAALDFCTDVIPTITIKKQDWADCPFPNQPTATCFVDGRYLRNTRICNGSLWKLCPPRLDMDCHEIHMDNDLILVRMSKKIKNFLSNNIPLVLQDKVRFFGRYDHLFDKSVIGYNSGLVGLPPSFDLKTKLINLWQEQGRPTNISYAEEQAFVCKVLTENKHILIENKELVEFSADGFFVLNAKRTIDHIPYEYTGREIGYHFLEVNRLPHKEWPKFKNRLILHL